MPIYRGVGGANREIKQIFRGVNGVNRKIQQQYRGINGTNRIVFRDGYGLDEIAQVVFKVYSASAVSLYDNVTYNDLEMKLVRLSTNEGGLTKYEFRIPTNEQMAVACASIQVSGEYKIKFLDGNEFPFNNKTLTEILGITNMTVKYCMGAFPSGAVVANDITGRLQVLDQTETTITAFPEIFEYTRGLILKKSVSYINKYPQSSLVSLSTYTNTEKTYPTGIKWFTNWQGETGLNHVFLQKEQYTYESDIAIVDARK